MQNNNLRKALLESIYRDIIHICLWEKQKSVQNIIYGGPTKEASRALKNLVAVISIYSV